jgi:hypothetical protein
MCVQEILYVLPDGWRQFFDLDGDHIQKTQIHTFLDFKNSSADDASWKRLTMIDRMLQGVCVRRLALCEINRDPRLWRQKSLGCRPC